MTETVIFETNGRKYQIGVLTVDDQWLVAKRIMSGLTKLSRSADTGNSSQQNVSEESTEGQEQETPFSKMSVEERKMALIFFIRQVLVELSDEDSRKVMNTCLRVCRLYDELAAGGTWRPVLASGPGLAMRDGNIGLDEMITLVLQVIENNLGNFLFGSVTP